MFTCHLEGRSHNREKHLFALSCSPVCVRRHASAPFPPHGLTRVCILGGFYKYLSRNAQISLKSDNNIANFTWKVLLSVNGDMNWAYRNFSATLNVVIFLAETQKTHCCLSIATMVTRTRHNFTLYVHSLSCCHTKTVSFKLSLFGWGLYYVEKYLSNES